MRNTIVLLSFVVIIVLVGAACESKKKSNDPRYPYTTVDKAVNTMLNNAKTSVWDSTDSGVRVKQDIETSIISNDHQNYTIRAKNYTTKDEVIINCELKSNGSFYGVDCNY